MVKFIVGNAVLLFLLFIQPLKAQDNHETVSYQLIFSEDSSHSLEQTAINGGLHLADFGQWLSNQVSIQKSVEGIGIDTPVMSQLLFFVVNRRGSVLSQNSLSFEASSNPVLLRNSINVNNLSRTLNAVFINQDCRISGNVLISGEKLFPGGFLIGSIYESQRLAANAANRAFSESSSGADGFTLVMLVAPEIEDFDYSVDPGTAAFFCKSAE